MVAGVTLLDGAGAGSEGVVAMLQERGPGPSIYPGRRVAPAFHSCGRAHESGRRLPPRPALASGLRRDIARRLARAVGGAAALAKGGRRRRRRTGRRAPPRGPWSRDREASMDGRMDGRMDGALAG
eukprot:scaffold5421_cov350-Prasinococcus_capsulatus_cf.AAC.2